MGMGTAGSEYAVWCGTIEAIRPDPHHITNVDHECTRNRIRIYPYY